MKANSNTTIARTRRELADAMGLRDESRISRYTAKGMPVNADGTYDVDACFKWREANVRKKKDHDRELLRWRAKHEKEKAKIARIKRLQLEDQMLEVLEVWEMVLPVSEAISRLADAVIDSEQELDPKILRLITESVESLSPLQSQLSERASNTIQRKLKRGGATRKLICTG